MELFKNIRLKIGKANLSKKITRTNRKVHYSNISLVKSIGIVWDASRPEDFASISKFYQKMHERKIEVKIISYFPGENLPDKYTAVRYLSFLRRNELNIFYQPDSQESKDFINTKYDILVDINFKNDFTLQFISSLSNASFKVGLLNSEITPSPFDLMMEIKKPVDIENYLNQIIHYLEMINAKSAKKVINN